MEKYQLRKSPPKKILTNYSKIERVLLFNRSIKNEDDAERFLSVSYDRDVLDPFLMTGMKEAVSRILKAMRSGEKIAIFGDFDADGLCATVCWKDFFFRAGYENVTFYIPHRHDEGFGVSKEALSTLAEEGASLVITVDCGIADSKVFDDSKDLGLDIIVTDHHEPVNGLPKVKAVVDPKRKDCSYPNPNLSGAGVAFKVIQGVLSKDRFGIPEGHEKWLLDLVALATISDSVPLTGENRVLTRYGLLVLRKSSRVGIVKLCRKLYLSQRNITEDDIGFMIAPRLNAASRMGDIKDAFTLLSTHDESEAEEAVKGLERLNNERKGVVASMVKEVKTKTSVLEESEVIVTGNPNWRPSLLGLVANSLAQEYSKPVFLWGRDGSQTIKGSCRSYGNVDLLSLMSSTEKIFKQFGGHRFAGGFSVDFKTVHTLREILNEAYSKTENISCEEKEEVDSLLSLDDVNETFYKKIERFSPFGVDNPKPVFRFSNLLVERVKLFGKKSEHLELVFKNSSGREVKAIGFFVTTENFKIKLKEGEKIDLIANIEKSYFGGRVELRLRVIDIV
jgi:single-stranded-DNA-specific exonuclease